MKSKGISTPYLLAITGVLISGMVAGLEADTLLGLQDDAVAKTLPLVAQRVESVMVSLEGLDQATVEMDLQRELNFTLIEGEPSIQYQDNVAEIEPGMDYQIEEGSSDTLCLVQKSDESVKIAPGGC